MLRNLFGKKSKRTKSSSGPKKEDTLAKIESQLRERILLPFDLDWHQLAVEIERDAEQNKKRETQYAEMIAAGIASFTNSEKLIKLVTQTREEIVAGISSKLIAEYAGKPESIKTMLAGIANSIEQNAFKAAASDKSSIKEKYEEQINHILELWYKVHPDLFNLHLDGLKRAIKKKVSAELDSCYINFPSEIREALDVLPQNQYEKLLPEYLDFLLEILKKTDPYFLKTKPLGQKFLDQICFDISEQISEVLCISEKDVKTAERQITTKLSTADREKNAHAIVAKLASTTNKLLVQLNNGGWNIQVTEQDKVTIGSRIETMSGEIEKESFIESTYASQITDMFLYEDTVAKNLKLALIGLGQFIASLDHDNNKEKQAGIAMLFSAYSDSTDFDSRLTF